MSTTTPRSGTPLLAASQAQKHVTHNEALLQLDALLFSRILDRDLSAPPANPADGDTYLVAANPTGAWAGQSGKIAFAVDGGWRFYAPFAGLTAFVADESVMLVYTATGWKDFASVMAFQNVPLLGVNTTADAANKFALKSNAALFAALEAANGGTGDMQVKLNKETAAKTASLLYQTSFSGRAEMGLTGDDNWHLKVSQDGAAWKEALVVDKATGNMGLGTSNPTANLHISGAVPALKIQDTTDASASLQISHLSATQSSMNLVSATSAVMDFNPMPSDGASLAQFRFFRATNTTGSAGFFIHKADGTSASNAFISANGNSYLNALAGNVGIGTTVPTGKLDVNDDHLRVRTAKTPATSASAGNQGDIAWDASYVYVCVAANAWKRAALASW